MCVCLCVLPYDKNQGKDGGKYEDGEQNQEDHQTQITIIPLYDT